MSMRCREGADIDAKHGAAVLTMAMIAARSDGLGIAELGDRARST